MTPQEIFEYKNKWCTTDCYAARVNIDLWSLCNDFCKKQIARQSWLSKRYAYPDDSHMFFFEKHEDYIKFIDTFDCISKNT